MIEAGVLDGTEDPELVMLGKDDEPDPGTAKPLPEADAEPVADALPKPAKPVTITDVGWSGCAMPVRESSGSVTSGIEQPLLEELLEELLDEELEELDALEEASEDVWVDC